MKKKVRSLILREVCSATGKRFQYYDKLREANVDFLLFLLIITVPVMLVKLKSLRPF